MKRILVAAGVGLCLFATTTAMSSNDNVRVVDYSNAIASDTTPKKDTSKPKPKPDSSSIALTPCR